MNDNSPEPRGISNLRGPSFTPSEQMIEAMLADKSLLVLPPAMKVEFKEPVRFSERSLAAVAENIVNSDPVLRTFAAPEWDCLHDDGKQWIIAIVRETLRRADALISADGGHNG